MALLKISDFDPNYRQAFDGNDIKGMGVFSQGTNEKIGTVSDVLVDEKGNFRYLVVDLGFWIFGKKVLLPVGRSQIDHNSDRVYAVGLTRQQAEDLPEFKDNITADYEYEEQVRGVYRTPVTGSAAGVSPAIDATAPFNAPIGTGAAPLDTAISASTPAPLNTATPLNTPTPLDAPVAGAAITGDTLNQPHPDTYNRDTYTYQQDAPLYELNDRDHQTLKLYEERLIANKNRVKTGEVAIGKRVETETARVSVPLEKERVVVERTTPADAGTAVAPGTADFREGEVARVEVYEETADIRKEAFVREEVNVTKVVDHETADARETIRREELDVKTEGTPVVDRPDTPPNRLV
jgi:uncharacterized protein (TIGR02271 family)